jgi:hypothetical protein
MSKASQSKSCAQAGAVTTGHAFRHNLANAFEILLLHLHIERGDTLPKVLSSNVPRHSELRFHSQALAGS